MSKKLRLIKPLPAVLVVAIGLFGCKNLSNIANTSSTATVTSGELNNNLPRVVATTSVLCDLTKQIAQETIRLTCLIPPKVNSRLYEPKIEDRRAIEQATLILYNGYNLEPSLLKLIKASKNSKLKIAVAQRAVPEPLRFRKNGELVPNPYVWHNTKNGIRMVEVIQRNLDKTIPENASLYRSNAQNIKNELMKLDSWIKSRIATIPVDQRELVTTYNAMSYYAKAYGLSYAPALVGTSDQKIDTKRATALARYIKRSNIPIVFSENTNNFNLIKSVVKNTKAKVSERQLFTNSLDEPGSEGDTYQKTMVANTRTIVEGLGGTYLIFEPMISK